MKSLLRCPTCKSYTLQETCQCGQKADNPKPPKFSLEDKYGSYRRQAKLDERTKGGLL